MISQYVTDPWAPLPLKLQTVKKHIECVTELHDNETL